MSSCCILPSSLFRFKFQDDQLTGIADPRDARFGTVRHPAGDDHLSSVMNAVRQFWKQPLPGCVKPSSEDLDLSAVGMAA